MKFLFWNYFPIHHQFQPLKLTKYGSILFLEKYLRIALVSIEFKLLSFVSSVSYRDNYSLNTKRNIALQYLERENQYLLCCHVSIRNEKFVKLENTLFS